MKEFDPSKRRLFTLGQSDKTQPAKLEAPTSKGELIVAQSEQAVFLQSLSEDNQKRVREALERGVPFQDIMNEVHRRLLEAQLSRRDVFRMIRDEVVRSALMKFLPHLKWDSVVQMPSGANIIASISAIIDKFYPTKDGLPFAIGKKIIFSDGSNVEMTNITHFYDNGCIIHAHCINPPSLEVQKRLGMPDISSALHCSLIKQPTRAIYPLTRPLQFLYHRIGFSPEAVQLTDKEAIFKEN